jgi:hypothetical protein
VNKGHGRIETRITTTSEMLNGGATENVIALQMKSSLELPVSREQKQLHPNYLTFAALIEVSKQVPITDAM